MHSSSNAELLDRLIDAFEVLGTCSFANPFANTFLVDLEQAIGSQQALTVVTRIAAVTTLFALLLDPLLVFVSASNPGFMRYSASFSLSVQTLHGIWIGTRGFDVNFFYGGVCRSPLGEMRYAVCVDPLIDTGHCGCAQNQKQNRNNTGVTITASIHQGFLTSMPPPLRDRRR
jgi:hypothetical protein